MNRTPRVSLEMIDVREPCSRDWDAMAGNDRRRFCRRCNRHVHNLSAMTRDEAERLVCDAAGRLCVRYERMASGTVRTLDYAKPPSGARGWRFWSGIGLLGALAAAVLGALWEQPRATTGVVVGRMPTPISVRPSPPSSSSVKGQTAPNSFDESEKSVAANEDNDDLDDANARTP